MSAKKKKNKTKSKKKGVVSKRNGAKPAVIIDTEAVTATYLRKSYIVDLVFFVGLFALLIVIRQFGIWDSLVSAF